MSTEVTMPDSSVFGALMRGHAGVAQDLEQLRAKGEIIVVPWSTYTEIKKTPNPVTKAVQLALIEGLGMKVQGETSLVQRAQMYEQRWSLYDDEKTVGLQKKDLPIVSDVWFYQQSVDGKTKTVKLWTVERMANNQITIARNFQIRFSPLSRATPVGKFVKPEQVLALFPSLKDRFKVTADGRIVRRFWTGKIGTGIKIGIKAGAIIGGLAVNALLGIFMAKVYAHFAQKELDRQLGEIRPQMEKDIRSRTEEALDMIASKGQAFAVHVITISVHNDPIGGAASMPVVRYRGMTISPTKTESHTRHREHPQAGYGGYVDIDTYTTSTPITFDEDFTAIYKDYRYRVDLYQYAIETTRSFAEARKLEKELREMVAEMKRFLLEQQYQPA